MKLLNQLERRFGKYAIHNLITYIIFANAIVFVMDKIARPGVVYNLLAFNPQAFLSGEIWRMFTFVFLPGTTSFIWIIFFLMFYHFIGSNLEHYFGAFKFNVFYFTGMIFAVLGALLTGTVVESFYLNLSMLLAFAAIHPNFEVRLYFFIPLKIKYLAYVYAGIQVFLVIIGDMNTKISVITGLLNFLLFFGRDLVKGQSQKRKTTANRVEYTKKVKAAKAHSHKCTVCGRTEKDDPNLEFRFCSKCNGYYEYCSDHLFNHEHKK